MYDSITERFFCAPGPWNKHFERIFFRFFTSVCSNFQSVSRKPQPRYIEIWRQVSKKRWRQRLDCRLRHSSWHQHSKNVLFSRVQNITCGWQDKAEKSRWECQVLHFFSLQIEKLPHRISQVWYCFYNIIYNKFRDFFERVLKFLVYSRVSKSRLSCSFRGNEQQRSQRGEHEQ